MEGVHLVRTLKNANFAAFTASAREEVQGGHTFQVRYFIWDGRQHDKRHYSPTHQGSKVSGAIWILEPSAPS
eukprot:250479-Pelagomonas_calceolata.AAC.2